MLLILLFFKLGDFFLFWCDIFFSWPVSMNICMHVMYILVQSFCSDYLSVKHLDKFDHEF